MYPDYYLFALRMPAQDNETPLTGTRGDTATPPSPAPPLPPLTFRVATTAHAR